MRFSHLAMLSLPSNGAASTCPILRNALALALCLLLSTGASAAQGDVRWAGQAGGPTADEGATVIVDADGNVYLTGHFTGTADLDPGPGTFLLTAAGLRDIFVIKLDKAQNFLWARQLSGPDDEEGASIAVDSAGNSFVTGYFSGTVDFDPGPGIAEFTAVGARDIFVTKLSPDGDYLATGQMGGPDIEFAFSIAIDALDNVVIAGYFESTVDFDPGPGSLTLHSYGHTDAFVAKYDASGGCLWARQMGGPSNQIAYSVAVDHDQNVYTTGYFSNITDFDGEATTYNLTALNKDIFVAKLDAHGALVWAKQMGGPDDERGSSVAVDPAGNVLVTGGFHGTVDFDPGPQVFELTSREEDIFVAKLDALGNFAWARQFGGSADDEGIALTVDTEGNIYTSGYFDGAVDFGIGPGPQMIFTLGNWDVYVAKLDPNGAPLWVRQLGSSSYDLSTSIALDPRGRVYTTGFFYGSLDVGTDVTFNSNGLQDVFIASIETVPTGEEFGVHHTVDSDQNFVIGLSELLRTIQFYNSGGFHCAAIPTDTEDGYVPGAGDFHECPPHDTDYNTQDWVISLTELLRIIQLYNSLGYRYCPDDATEDDYCPGP